MMSYCCWVVLLCRVGCCCFMIWEVVCVCVCVRVVKGVGGLWEWGSG